MFQRCKCAPDASVSGIPCLHTEYTEAILYAYRDVQHAFLARSRCSAEGRSTRFILLRHQLIPPLGAGAVNIRLVDTWTMNVLLLIAVLCGGWVYLNRLVVSGSLFCAGGQRGEGGQRYSFETPLGPQRCVGAQTRFWLCFPCTYDEGARAAVLFCAGVAEGSGGGRLKCLFDGYDVPRSSQHLLAGVGGKSI